MGLGHVPGRGCNPAALCGAAKDAQCTYVCSESDNDILWNYRVSYKGRSADLVLSPK
jgi:hypothetical protein